MLKSFKWRLPDAWQWAILVWFIVRLVLTVIGILLIGLHAVPANSPYGNLYFEIVPLRDGWPSALLGVWQRWDAIHYQRIASFGYGGEGLLAFFPLYPLLARLLSYVLGGNILLAMLVISNVATIVAFAMLYRLAEELFSTAVARRTVIALAIYPAAIYLYAPYAEPLALCLILVAYQAIRQMHWKIALLTGIAAGLSQPVAVPAVVLLAWEVWQKRQFKMMPLAVALGPAIGAGAYFVWMKLNLSQSYIGVQFGWGNSIQWPWLALMNIPELFRMGMILINGWINLFALTLAAATTIWSIKKHLPRSITLFQIAVMLMLLITSHTTYPLNDFARHTLIVFPVFIVLGNWYKNSRHLIWCLAASAAAFIYSSVTYFLWR